MFLRKLWVFLVAVTLAAACTGETGRVPPPAADGGNTNTTTRADTGPPPACSAKGSPANCDPVTGDGCGDATCYLVAKKGPSCVCKKGKANEGKPCNTTIECGAGLVCAGKKAPGVCRKTCAPSSGGCPSATGTAFCRTIDAFPDYGYCDLPNQ
jgi:hypothetical protein